MFRAVRIHERVRPGEDDIHASALMFDEIEAEEFAALHIQRLVTKFLAQAGLLAMDPHLRHRRIFARQLPFRHQPTTGPGAQDGVTVHQSRDTLPQRLRRDGGVQFQFDLAGISRVTMTPHLMIEAEHEIIATVEWELTGH